MSPNHRVNPIRTAAIHSNVFSHAIKCFTLDEPLTELKLFNEIKGWQDTAKACVCACFEKWRRLSNKPPWASLASVRSCSEGVRPVLATAWHQTDPRHPLTMLTLGINTWTPEMDVWWGPKCTLSVCVCVCGRACVFVFLGDWGRGHGAPPASSQTQWSEWEALSFVGPSFTDTCTHLMMLPLVVCLQTDCLSVNNYSFDWMGHYFDHFWGTFEVNAKTLKMWHQNMECGRGTIRFDYVEWYIQKVLNLHNI